MNCFPVKTILLGAGLLIAGHLKAQDMGQIMIENAQATQNAYLSSHIDGLVLSNMTGKGKKAGTVTESYLTYNPSPKIRDRVINNMAAKMKLNAQNVQALKQIDFNKTFTDITAPYHLQYDDAADVVTAYQVLNWMIANKAGNPKPAAVSAVKQSVIASLQQNRNIRHDAGNRAMLGEEMKIMFTLLHAGLQEATKNGTLQQYSNNINKQFQQLYHQDLRQVKLDEKGMHP